MAKVGQAPRRLLRDLRSCARGVLLAGCLWPIGSGAVAEVIVGAEYADPTDRYAHGVLGDAIEWGALRVFTEAEDGSRRTYRIELPQSRVFEDLEPRVLDLDGDGAPEVMVVESHQDLGAQLAVYDQSGKRAATPHIGRRNRWLAPVGAADLDGDGRVEIGFVDRPHLAKTLRLWRLEGDQLMPVAQWPGVTNHRIGDAFISSGIRTCPDEPVEMVMVSADWTLVVAIRFDGSAVTQIAIGPYENQRSLRAALDCAN